MEKVLEPVHPGEILAEEFLEPFGISPYKLAQDIGVDPPRVYEIIKGKRSISADTALRLAHYFGTSARFWLNLQTHYDLEVAKDTLGERLQGEGIRKVPSKINQPKATERRDWEAEVQEIIEEYGELLEEEDLDSIVSSKILKNSTALLLEISSELKSLGGNLKSLSGDIKFASKEEAYSPRKLQEMLRTFKALEGTYDSIKATYDNLEKFCVRAIEAHKAKFGDQAGEAAYSVVDEAERILQESNR